jgi:hypothetical protein
LIPSTERMLLGVANLPKGASYTKVTGAAKAKPQRNDCLVTVGAWWAQLSGRLSQSKVMAYLCTDNQNRSASLERNTLPTPSQRQWTQS